jgi:hypothetical protein
MQLAVTVNGTLLTALLDFGSTHNFMDLEAASRASIVLSGQAGLHVVMANRDRVQCPGSCRDMSMIIGDELFHLHCYRLTLGSYDMMLGVHWLESLGPILWDFGRRTISVRNGHNVLWTAASLASSPSTALAAIDDVLEDLQLRFADLFAEPSGLPPVRPRCYQINLLPGMLPVVIRPYRYAHPQKAELESSVRPCCAKASSGQAHRRSRRRSSW